MDLGIEVQSSEGEGWVGTGKGLEVAKVERDGRTIEVERLEEEGKSIQRVT